MAISYCFLQFFTGEKNPPFFCLTNSPSLKYAFTHFTEGEVDGIKTHIVYYFLTGPWLIRRIFFFYRYWIGKETGGARKKGVSKMRIR